MMSVRASMSTNVWSFKAVASTLTKQRMCRWCSSNHQRKSTPGAMATAYLPLLSCTVGARDALIAACILWFNHTHSVLPT
jgi:hypothetical protein